MRPRYKGNYRFFVLIMGAISKGLQSPCVALGQWEFLRLPHSSMLYCVYLLLLIDLITNKNASEFFSLGGRQGKKKPLEQTVKQ